MGKGGHRAVITNAIKVIFVTLSQYADEINPLTAGVAYIPVFIFLAH